MMSDEMQFTSALSTEETLDTALQELIEDIKAELRHNRVDFVMTTFSPHFVREAGDLRDSIQAAFAPDVVIGCTAEGIIGRDAEVEQRYAIAVLAGHLPDVGLHPFVLEPTAWQQMLASPETFVEAVGAPADSKLFVTLADPFSTPMDEVLDAFNTAYADLPVVGGMASGSRRPGGNALIANERIVNAGVVGLAFTGELDVDVIVSQGCRPIGPVYTVTESDNNVIRAIDGEPPLELFQKLAQTLPDDDRVLLKQGLFVGRAIDSGTETLGRGDFLIRNVAGVDPDSGALAVQGQVSTGEKIQFHVRDAETAEEDLAMMLTPHSLFDPPSGALLFSCNGRGTRLYDRPNGDISTIQNVIGEVELAGFFCAGEIGPIGGRNFLHGHTASMALFRPPAHTDENELNST